MDIDLAKKMRRFYAPPQNFEGGSLFLDADEARHLKGVLRLREGMEARVFDGEGNEYSCRIEDIGKRSARLSILAKIEPMAPESPLFLHLAMALVKGEKFDLVVQKAVELGVSRVSPIITKRTEPKISQPGKKIERWRKIVMEASKQCGRAKLMGVSEPVAFESFIASASEKMLLFAERGGEGLGAVCGGGKIAALIGPEGGWEDDEISFAKKNGAAITTLYGRTLRAETAGIAIAALLQNRFGDFR